ncbi:MAG: dihydroneopterin aldolase [Deltaproteobacteria bacterium]|nr:dihydroneopterin aldolase [Deltaproteobacteria bacterium]
MGRARQTPDRVRLLGLRVDASIGVYPHERTFHQRLMIDIAVDADLHGAAASDDVRQTVDYDRLAAIARDVATDQHHQLIETVAVRIAERVLEALGARVAAVEVRVAKPGAVPDAADVAVEVRRERRVRAPRPGRRAKKR